MTPKPPVQIHIRNLVIEGYSRRQAERIAQSIHAELACTFADRVPAPESVSEDIERAVSRAIDPRTNNPSKGGRR